jgi:flavin-dependent dehydrogenase
VGDAGYHKDPLTAEGIGDAFRDAELLADALDDGLSGRTPMEDALAGYEERRNTASMPYYEFTCNIASMEPMEASANVLFQAISRNQEQTNRFLGIAACSVAPDEFFSPENITQILAGAA